MLIKRILFLILLIMFFLSQCVSVKPWQRKKLGDIIMQPNEDPIENSINEHLFQRNEGTGGGTDDAEGSCGC